MGITYDDSEVRKAFDGFQRDFDPMAKRVIERWQFRVGARAVQAHMMRESFGQHFREDYPATGGKLRNRSGGRLAKSLQANKGFESFAPIRKVGPGVWEGQKGSAVTTPRGYYLLDIHERGALVPVTDRSRMFFWYQYKQTGDDRWKAMALQRKPRMLIPARPVLIPAFEETKRETYEDARRELGKSVRVHFVVA